VFDQHDTDASLCRGGERPLDVLPNLRRPGLAGARNTGIVEASHDYVAFLDDDDYWLPGKLQAQMLRFEAKPDAVLVGTAMVVDDGERTHERLVPLDVVHQDDLFQDRMAGLHSSTFVFRRDALLGPVGLVDEDLPGSYGEDYDLLLRTSAVAPVEVVNEPLVSVTWSGQSYFFGKWSAYADGLQYLLETHPGFRRHRKAHGRIASQIGFARAAAGERRAALRWVRESLRADPTQVKAWLALGISLRLLSAAWVVRVVQRMGKGI
jgi:glycosyltransferase involved in cell wall biosynthesis